MTKITNLRKPVWVEHKQFDPDKGPSSIWRKGILLGYQNDRPIVLYEDMTREVLHRSVQYKVGD